jgi:hypothetical protein
MSSESYRAGTSICPSIEELEKLPIGNIYSKSELAIQKVPDQETCSQY